MGRVYLTKSLEDRVWPKVNKRGPTECWEWQGARGTRGYGFLVFDSRKPTRYQRRAHRVVYEMTHGPIPDGMVVMHICDNPPCVNPRHLRLGSFADNTRDAWKKGLITGGGARFGEAHWRASLTWDQVREIRSRYRGRGQPSHDVLAAEYGVSRPTISQIIEGKTYPESERPA